MLGLPRLLGGKESSCQKKKKTLPAKQETQGQSLGQEDPLKKKMATYSSILAWEMPWTEESGRLQSMGSQRVGQDLVAEHACSVVLGLVFKCLFTYLFLWQHQVSVVCELSAVACGS